MAINNCQYCGTPLRVYNGKLFCVNCDPKPWEMEEDKEKDETPPRYV